jgi:hypothetical protein
VVCQAFAKPQQPDRRQKTIVCPTCFPAPIPPSVGHLIFLTAWKMAGEIRSSETNAGTLPRHDKIGVNAQNCTKTYAPMGEAQMGPNQQKCLGLPMPQFCFFNRGPKPPALPIAQPPIPAGSEFRLWKLASWTELSYYWPWQTPGARRRKRAPGSEGVGGNWRRPYRRKVGRGDVYLRFPPSGGKVALSGPANNGRFR